MAEREKIKDYSSLYLSKESSTIFSVFVARIILQHPRVIRKSEVVQGKERLGEIENGRAGK